MRDGGGVKPDVEVKPDSLPNIAFYLAGARDSNEVMLNYEVDYIAKHPTIAPAKEFSLTDADYDEFKTRVLKLTSSTTVKQKSISRTWKNSLSLKLLR